MDTLARQRRKVDLLQAELDRSLSSLLTAGEGETLEFKAAARWDHREGTVSRAIEGAVARTLAGFMNHRGGSLLLGVDDRGTPIGLRADFASLRRPDRDGFEQFLIGLAERQLGAHSCAQLHTIFHEIDGHVLCRVVVEAAAHPVYLRDERGDHYFLRTGNGTRELDAREAVDHITGRGIRPA
jgi:predicted HTH transcriptional regulator